MNREFGLSIVCWWNVVRLRTGQGKGRKGELK